MAEARDNSTTPMSFSLETEIQRHMASSANNGLRRSVPLGNVGFSLFKLNDVTVREPTLKLREYSQANT